MSVTALLGWVVACSDNRPTAPSPNLPTTLTPPGTRTAVLVGAGDIGQCGSPGVVATARLVQNIDGEVFLAGDIAYFQGTRRDFANCFDPFWGGLRSRWRPVPGNHEYESQDGAPYFEYFGDAAGVGNLGYYRFIAGEWLVLMLNSNIDVGRGSPQFEFARENLDRFPSRCAMAIWHHPLFSSGPNGNHPFMRDMWLLLYDKGADVVISAHDHMYERFSRQTPDGVGDSTRGIRQFIVGTGGASLVRPIRVAPNSGIRISSFGVLKINLRPTDYDWQFIEVGGNVTDNGVTNCH